MNSETKLKDAKNAENVVLGEFFHSQKLLKVGEVLDDLGRNGLMLIQNTKGYKFSTDSVLLSSFASVKKKDFYVDLCSGSGVVAFLTMAKNGTKTAHLVEIQNHLADMAKRSAQYNGLDGVKVTNADLSDAHKILGHEVADVITINPPYFESGKTSEKDEIAICTHELATNLESICKEAFKLLKFGGKLFMVHAAERLSDILFNLKKYKLEPKRLRIVYPKVGKAPNLVLIEAKKGASSGIKIEQPLVLCDEQGNETDELKQIYNR